MAIARPSPLSVAICLLFVACRSAKGRETDAGAVDPCASAVCVAGMHCKAVSSDCARAPCPKVGECVPDPEENPCNVTDCPANRVCVVEHGQATCLPVPSDDDEDDAGLPAAPDDAGPMTSTGA